MQKQVIYLQISKYRRLYNDNVRKSLEKIGIKYSEVSTKFGYRLMVNESDFSAASRAILSIPLR
jgi:hypothetical protein